MRLRVLHVLSQKPSSTGSGITLRYLVLHSAKSNFEQRVVCAKAADDEPPVLPGIENDNILALEFGNRALPFSIPGMSDVMPYPSTRFSQMSPAQIEDYLDAFANHIQRVLRDFKPDVIHAHHVWLVSSILKDLAPGIRVVTHCHATGLRQMELCPHLAKRVRRGCARNDRFVVLTSGHRERLAQICRIDPSRIMVVGAGYSHSVFGLAPELKVSRADRLLYAGKYSAAKGVSQLLNVFERMNGYRRGLQLCIAGSGSGDEAEAIRRRMDSMPGVLQHGMLEQKKLAALMQSCHVIVLPSFYEGLPLVLVEALATGCHLVASGLDGIVCQLVPHLKDTLTLVEPPAMLSIDQPQPDQLPSFERRLEKALESSLAKPALKPEASMLEPFRWRAVFERILQVWRMDKRSDNINLL